MFILSVTNNLGKDESRRICRNTVFKIWLVVGFIDNSVLLLDGRLKKMKWYSRIILLTENLAVKLVVNYHHPLMQIVYFWGN